MQRFLCSVNDIIDDDENYDNLISINRLQQTTSQQTINISKNSNSSIINNGLNTITDDFRDLLKFSYSDISNPANILYSSPKITQENLIFNDNEYLRVANLFKSGIDIPVLISGHAGTGKTTLIMSLLNELPNPPIYNNFRFYKKYDIPTNNSDITSIFNNIDTTTTSNTNIINDDNDDIDDKQTNTTTTVSTCKMLKYGRIYYINMAIIGTIPEKLAYIKLIQYLCENSSPNNDPIYKYIFVITNIQTCPPLVIIQLEKCITRYNIGSIAGFILTTTQDSTRIITPKIRGCCSIYRMKLLDMKTLTMCLKRTFYTVIPRFEHKDCEKMYKFYLINEGNIGITLSQINYWRTHNTNRTANISLIQQICWSILNTTKLSNANMINDLRTKLYGLTSIGITVDKIMNATVKVCMGNIYLKIDKKIKISQIASDVNAKMQNGERELIWLEYLYIRILEIIYSL